MLDTNSMASGRAQPVGGASAAAHLFARADTRLYLVAVTGLLALTALWLGAGSLLYPFGRDQAEYAYIADAVLHGKVSYVDVFNVKPPLTYVVHQLALLWFGHSMLSIRVLDLIWQFATALVLVFIAYRLLRRRWLALLPAILYLFWYYTFGYWDTAQTDGWQSLPLALGILSFLLAWPRQQAWLYALSGAALGVGVLLKYPVGLLPGLLGLLVLLRGRGGIRFALALAAGFVAPVAVSVLDLERQGALSEFLFIQFNYFPAYNGAHGIGNYISDLVSLFPRFTRHHPIFLLGLLVAAAEGLYLWRRRDDLPLLVILLWWFSALVSLVSQNKFYDYHSLPLLAPSALLTAYLALQLYRTIGQTNPARFAVPAALAAYVLGGWFIAGYPYQLQGVARLLSGSLSLEAEYASPDYGAYGNGYYSMQADLEAARYLELHTSPADQVFIWGFQPTVYFLAQRASASRFIYNYPLYGEWAWPQLRQQFLTELERTEPLYILVLDQDPLPWVTGTDDDSRTAFLKFVGLRDWVSSHYQPETVIEHFTFYRRLGSLASAPSR